MKLRLAILTLACLSLSMCVAPSARVGYRLGDGKGFVEFDGKTVSAGYSGQLPRGFAK